ncbi:MAG: hypothetical protein DI640_04840 [Sphingomonas taxi]|uniref:Murein endopeptidase K n=1 Tax=Sphingomonas taxi TaxID=1549858 RepID=A0A2W4YZ39_9SPHN|nr:MAG: hypothetical protein DI640_04840 [Sphingomonas taxi]
MDATKAHTIKEHAHGHALRLGPLFDRNRHLSNALFSRRDLINGGVAALVTAALSERVSARAPERRLVLINPHNGERYDACFFANGRYRADGLAELNHAMRDWRTGATRKMDPGLLDLLVRVRDRLDVPPRKPLKLVSGYRSPKTNRALHARSHGVASKSQHMLGKATDIAIPGVPLSHLRSAALSLRGGGVGYYPNDGFVHMDTGAVRHWS